MTVVDVGNAGLLSEGHVRWTLVWRDVRKPVELRNMTSGIPPLLCNFTCAAVIQMPAVALKTS